LGGQRRPLPRRPLPRFCRSRLLADSDPLLFRFSPRNSRPHAHPRPRPRAYKQPISPLLASPPLPLPLPCPHFPSSRRRLKPPRSPPLPPVFLCVQEQGRQEEGSARLFDLESKGLILSLRGEQEEDRMAIDHESPFKELRLKNRRIMVSYLAGAAHPLPSVFCSPRALPF